MCKKHDELIGMQITFNLVDSVKRRNGLLRIICQQAQIAGWVHSCTNAQLKNLVILHAQQKHPAVVPSPPPMSNDRKPLASDQGGGRWTTLFYHLTRGVVVGHHVE